MCFSHVSWKMLGETWESINIYTDYMIKTDKLWELENLSYLKNDRSLTYADTEYRHRHKHSSFQHLFHTHRKHDIS